MDVVNQGVNIKVVFGHRATIAEVDVAAPITIDTYEFVEATGEAVRSPEDKDDTVLAYNLAVGRALEALARKVLKRAEGRVLSNEHNAQHSANSAMTAPKPERKQSHCTICGQVGHNKRTCEQTSNDDITWDYHSGRCLAETAQGTQCTFNAKPFYDYCGIHA